MTDYLRRNSDGVIFDFNPYLAQEVGLELITEVEAFPERFRSETFVESAPSRDAVAPLSIALETSEIPDLFPPNDALNLDASRRGNSQILGN